MRGMVAVVALISTLAGPALAGSVLKVDVKSYGPSFPTMDTPAATPNGEMSDSVKQSIGCVVGGTAGTVAALSAGTENLINVIAGGLVRTANPVVLYTSLLGVVFASFCAVGQAMTPLVLYYAAPPPAAPPPPRNLLPRRLSTTEARSFRNQLKTEFERVEAIRYQSVPR